MLTVKASLQTFKLSDDLKWTTNTVNIHVTPFSLTFKALLTTALLLMILAYLHITPGSDIRRIVLSTSAKSERQ